MAKILYLIGIVALVVLVTVKMVVNPEIFDFDLSNITSYNITTGLVDIDVPIEPVNEIVNLASMIMYGRLTMMVDFASFYYIFTKFDKIIQHVKEEQPFHKYNLPIMFLIGKLFVIFSIALPIISLQFVWNIASNLPFDIDVNLAIHTGMLLLGGVILFLAGIFNYGAYLQDEYDQRCNHDCDSIR